jgi:hypothetical protein
MQVSLILLPVVAYLLLTLLFYRESNIKSALDAFVKAHLVIYALA